MAPLPLSDMASLIRLADFYADELSAVNYYFESVGKCIVSLCIVRFADDIILVRRRLPVPSVPLQKVHKLYMLVQC